VEAQNTLGDLQGKRIRSKRKEKKERHKGYTEKLGDKPEGLLRINGLIHY
jgi:hypothetical protein